MSQGTVLIIAGALICLGGLAKLGSSQVGGFSLKNFGINFGGSITQTSRVGDVSPEAAKTHKPDWALSPSLQSDSQRRSLAFSSD